MTRQAIGNFDITMTPTGAPGNPIGTMALAKTYHGDLSGTSTGHMLAFRSAVEGSAGYVAMERVTGVLEGRTGAFTLQHNGLMDKGVPSLSVVVVPDSGSEDLVGLTGSLDIIISPGRHDYKFTYNLPE
ncbi:DUF3224 domain-containing protein [Novosphingobium sp.]|uniref:DUF3224 domain-containing protein n=1 Tax=Novosphingobium sp. TaxID=1874826 RepID=UPI003B522C8A